jgi:hypothetical protein
MLLPLQRLQVLNQILLLLLRQIQLPEIVVVIDDVKQGTKTPIVVKPAFHVREQSA